jgi:hypothetical protein
LIYGHISPYVSSRMVRIGPWPGVSLADARKAARGYAGAVARGDDPAAAAGP